LSKLNYNATFRFTSLPIAGMDASLISGIFFVTKIVRSVYPIKMDLTISCVTLPKKENSNNGNMLQIRNEKMKRLSNRVYCIRDVIG
jgi:hypothetical protein